MDFEEVKEYMTTNKDSEEVKGYIAGLNPLTSDRVNTFLDTEDGKRFIQPKMDSYATKGIESFKTNNLDKIYSERFAKENPKSDPRDLALATLQKQFEDMKSSTAREKLTNSTLKQFNTLKLPTELAEFMIGSDEQSTATNIATLQQIFATHDETIKTGLIKGNNYAPPKNEGNVGSNALEDEVRKAMKLPPKK